MTGLANLIMTQRARSLHARLAAHLTGVSSMADIGSGTGHNAQVIREANGITVEEFDVADLHWAGPGPQLFDGITLPLADGTCDASLLLYVLHYADDPEALLREAGRVARTRVLLLQSTSERSLSRTLVTIREWITGRLAFQLARIAGMIRPQFCPLAPRRYFARPELEGLITQAGLRIVSRHSSIPGSLLPSRDLYVLEPIHAR